MTKNKEIIRDEAVKICREIRGLRKRQWYNLALLTFFSFYK